MLKLMLLSEDLILLHVPIFELAVQYLFSNMSCGFMVAGWVPFPAFYDMMIFFFFAAAFVRHESKANKVFWLREKKKLLPQQVEFFNIIISFFFSSTQVHCCFVWISFGTQVNLITYDFSFFFFSFFWSSDSFYFSFHLFECIATQMLRTFLHTVNAHVSIAFAVKFNCYQSFWLRLLLNIWRFYTSQWIHYLLYTFFPILYLKKKGCKKYNPVNFKANN